MYRSTTKDLCIFVESRLALCVLVASSESSLAINTASGVGGVGGMGGLARCSGVGRVGLAAAHEVVDEGVCVLACALGGFLRRLLVLSWMVVNG
jgi:hypothetical protein